jgi:hypothetical protein
MKMSDELGNTYTGTWSYPSPAYGYHPETDGMVWYGYEPPTEEDYIGLYHDMTSSPESTWTLEDFYANVHFDVLSLVGRWHPEWNSNWNQHKSNLPDTSSGGLGSDVYKRQRVGSGVKFADEPVWHYNPAGDLVKEVPDNCGAYHYDSQREVNVAGPQPDSQAAMLLGRRGRYYWDDKNQYWEIEGSRVSLPPREEPVADEMVCRHCGKRHPSF